LSSTAPSADGVRGCPHDGPPEPGDHVDASAERGDVGAHDIDTGDYLVTGGSRGLGFAAAQALVADGARIVLSAPHEATASSAVARLVQNAAAADPAAWVVADNADPATPDRLIAAAKDRFGRLPRPASRAR
jgi:hypothetical protein